jgi:hypothetical protein
MATQGLRLTCVDSSPTFTALCRELLPEHEWLVGDMRSRQPPGRFDGVLA